MKFTDLKQFISVHQMVAKYTLQLLFILNCFVAIAQDNARKAQMFYDDENYDSALLYVDKALENSPSYPAPILKLKADIISYQNQFLEAIGLYKNVIEQLEFGEIRDSKLKMKSYSEIGWCYAQLGLFEKANKFQHAARKLAIAANDKEETAASYFNLSTNHVRLTNYDSGIHYIQLAYDLDLESGDSLAISSDLNTLGYLFASKKDYTKALDYYTQSLSFVTKKDTRRLAVRYNNLGSMEMELSLFEEAESHILKSYELHASLKDSIKMMQRAIGLCQLYTRMDRLGQAKRNGQVAVAFFKKKNNAFFEVKARIHLAKAFEKGGEYERALNELKSVIQVCKSAGLLEDLIKAHADLIAIYERQNNVQEAFRYLKQNQIYIDSLSRNEQLQKVSNLELKFITEQNEKEVELLQLENRLKESEIERRRRESRVLLTGIILVVVFAAIIIFVQLQKFRLKKALLSQEIDTLRVRIQTILPPEVNISLHQLNEGLIKPLSQREFEILQHAITDKTNREIADLVFVSINTVKFHLRKIYEKLGVSNRSEALEKLLSKS
ncbi:LuxR C-terminal-related transcriptional regulator [Ekhidna sp.]|uniref:LuxR C-terminal-related transcriptional regulator n=1 Tax=Ekhidna sp. TaxID=2608089 RepID=UPI00329814E7